ncbi:peptidoglycan-binding protein [Halovulum dunhuangense]|uniref:Peptidoglycan-binding protein n=1 Tax=Halovulum dunhuangense TaxID=1505036 RepID=A0A849L3L8_9RHOB|nr:peptidoglycan-binding domain-containing protein [Halovulum dunhuangense]NNU80915.1 peptidoglycan-binding protein [Halovulum dunhuangense]
MRSAPLVMLLASLGLPAHAQFTPPPDPSALADVLTALTDEDAAAAEIATRLSACLRPLTERSPDHAPVVFAVDFGPDGAPGAAELVEPAAALASRQHLRQLIRAEAAIHECAPLDLAGDPVRDVTLVFRADADGIALDDGDTAQADDAPMTLSREERRQIQIRLRLAGHDAGSADGVFGPRTRSAIAAWQTEQGLLATGQLTTAQVGQLLNQTSDAYAEWEREQPARSAPAASTGGQRFYRDADGCLRYANGQIVPNRSLKCDVKGMFRF